MAVFIPEPVCYLNEGELERWREIRASLDAAENTSVFSTDEWQRVRGFYYDAFIAQADFIDAHHLSKVADLIISPTTGAVTYETVDIEVEG